MMMFYAPGDGDMAVFTMDKYYSGTCCDAYKYFGAHPISENDSGVVFRVYAPAAQGVDVVGEFNGWNGGYHPVFPTQELVSSTNSECISRAERLSISLTPMLFIVSLDLILLL